MGVQYVKVPASLILTFGRYSGKRNIVTQLITTLFVEPSWLHRVNDDDDDDNDDDNDDYDDDDDDDNYGDDDDDDDDKASL